MKAIPTSPAAPEMNKRYGRIVVTYARQNPMLRMEWGLALPTAPL
jgi:hypothetical protein